MKHVLLALALANLASPLMAVSALAERLASILDASPLTERTHVGVAVADADTGELLFARDARRLFVPASNAKLYTSACALATWGPDHRFATEIALDGRVDAQGVLEGDLILRGGGDPVLRSADLRAMARDVAEVLAVRRVAGDLVVDESLFDPTRKGPGWMWDDDPEAFNMSVSALMLDYNVLTVLSTGAANGVQSLALSPESDYPPIVGATDASTGLRVTRHPFQDVIIAEPAEGGGAPEPISVRLTMHNPARWAGGVFRAMLAEAGVEIAGEVRVVTQPTRVSAELAHESLPLREILTLFNKPSENAIGEMLIHSLAVKAGIVPGSWHAGAEVLSRWLAQEVGLDAGDFRLVDGSGLSRYNLICAEGTVKLLAHMWRHPHRDVFVASLPVAGVDGSLRGRMGGTAAAGRVHAKTGTMGAVSCLSGYVQTAGGRWLAFSILTNGYIGSSGPSAALQDRLCVAMAEDH